MHDRLNEELATDRCFARNWLLSNGCANRVFIMWIACRYAQLNRPR